MALRVLPDGSVEARAPYRASDKIIQQFIQKNKVWIEKTANRLKEQAAKIPGKRYQEGETFLYLGREYPLHIAEDMFGKLLFEDRFILAASHAAKAAKHFEKWYKQEAFMVFTQRCLKYAQEMNARYKKIALSSAKKRWGSCTPRGNLRFNWKLVKAPLEIVDYVVVHELAHLKELNHSGRFWTIVEKHCPAFQSARKWLKDYAHSLA